MCQNCQTMSRKAASYEAALLEIARLGNRPALRVQYARAVQLAEAALERNRRPQDVDLLSIDLAEGEIAGQ